MSGQKHIYILFSLDPCSLVVPLLKTCLLSV